MKFRIILVLVFLFFCFNSCKHENGEQFSYTENNLFAIKGFNPISNIHSDDSSLVTINLDYENAFENGFVVPSFKQTKDGCFIVKFEIENKSNKPKVFSYKLFYQNETYKFPEFITDKSYNSLASENFYGSWENTSIQFKNTSIIPADQSFHEVIDSIRIVGNPRNEIKYFENGVNNRWERNPRVGNYQFALIISDNSESAMKNIPTYVKDFSKAEGDLFKNPFYYFSSDELKLNENAICVLSGEILKVVAKPNLGNGIYYNSADFKGKTGFQTVQNCGQDSLTYQNSAFEQFVNNVDPSMRFENIPVIRDVMGDDYTKTDYNWDKAFYKRDELISVLPGVARTPCESVYSDKELNKITLRNPGCTEGNWRKESVGIRTRHGLTYGKYRVKCKLTELLNKHNVWNGLTNAIWLLYQQGSGAWNNRRSCEKEGYMATYWGGDNDKRIPVINYTEIDFEILKTPPYCPPFNFPPIIKNPTNDQFHASRWNTPFPEELQKDDDKVSVSCTNWDMACKQPVNFGSGCNEIIHGDSVYYSHRWTDNYRALTQKKLEKDDELFGSEFYYFEIDWRPTEIIWRIGPDPQHMREVGFMDETVTSIPNNQMTLIITQEYHNTKWWPGSPYMQENIPFPSKDLIGEIYELVIE